MHWELLKYGRSRGQFGRDGSFWSYPLTISPLAKGFVLYFPVGLYGSGRKGRQSLTVSLCVVP